MVCFCKVLGVRCYGFPGYFEGLLRFFNGFVHGFAKSKGLVSPWVFGPPVGACWLQLFDLTYLLPREKTGGSTPKGSNFA